MKSPALLMSLLAVAGFSFGQPAEAQVLQRVRSRGYLICGVNSGLQGFGSIDEAGNFAGFDVDICRAVSVAIFGNSDQVDYVSVSAAARQEMLRAGTIDLLSRNTTWTLERDRNWGVTYGPITFYDGQGFIVKADSGITQLEDLNGKTVCIVAGTTTEQNLAATFGARNIEFTPVVFSSDEGVFAAYNDGLCATATADRSSLFTRRLSLPNPDAHVLLEETISKEPLAPLIAQGDSQWRDILNWTVFAMIRAEELGITSQNIDSFRESPDSSVRTFLGIEGNLGALLGLNSAFAYNIISQVGNYGESFERHLTPLGFERGLNALGTEGGLIYSPPFR